MLPTNRASTAPGPWPIAFAGMVSLAIAMGIGRFAFTPLLPLMLKDGVIDLPRASWLASANYLGYFVGALLCTLQPWIWARFRFLRLLAFSSLVRAGLLTTCVLTLAMAWQFQPAWPWLRFAAGVTSAVVFIFTSGWCLSELARRGVPEMGGVIYMGPGAGIVVSGLFASGMVAWHWTAAGGWMIFGMLAFVLTSVVWKTLSGGEEHLVARGVPVAGANLRVPLAQGRAEMPLLTFAYGLAGFGYIITATFLPVIARAALPGSTWLDFFWPIFGAGIMTGAALATRIPARLDRRWLLTACYTLQALGVVCSLVLPSLAGFAAGSLMLGLPFTAITFFAMQEVRRLRPESAASLIGLLTAFYGVGQILGPPMVAVLMRHTPTASAGFTWSLEIAAGALVLGAGLFAWLARSYPLNVQGLPAR